MTVREIGLFIAVLCHVVAVSGSTLSDLCSTNQAIRDAAATILRDTYTPPPSTNWDALIASLKTGVSKTNALEIISPHVIRAEGGGGTGTWEFRRYRLDTLWVLECYFESNLFEGCKLIKYPGQMWANPPPHFTGISTIYFSNGQTNLQIHYKNGKQDGDMIVFTENGQESRTMRYLDGVWQRDSTNEIIKPSRVSKP